MKVNVYDLINNPTPELLVLQTIDVDVENFESVEGTIDILNKYFHMDKLASERNYCIGFNRDLKPTGIFFLGSGTCDKCLVDMRKMFTMLILTNTPQFECFHNHPSGSWHISESDVILTLQYKQMATLLSFEFMGHFMITKGYYEEVTNEFYCSDEEDVETKSEDELNDAVKGVIELGYESSKKGELSDEQFHFIVECVENTMERMKKAGYSIAKVNKILKKFKGDMCLIN